MYFCYEAWHKWHTKRADTLQEELSALTKSSSKGSGQGVGDSKAGGKGAKESGREAPAHKGKNADAVGGSCCRVRLWDMPHAGGPAGCNSVVRLQAIAVVRRPCRGTSLQC
jgi:hypothetical protein